MMFILSCTKLYILNHLTMESLKSVETLAYQLWEVTRGCATEVFPQELSKYKNLSNIAKNFPMCHMIHRHFEEGTLVASPAGKMLVSPLNHLQIRSGIRMHSVKANVMPYHTVTPHSHHSLFDIVIKFGQLTPWNWFQSLKYWHGWQHYSEW